MGTAFLVPRVPETHLECETVLGGQHTSTVAHSFVLDNVVMLQGLQDFDLPFEVSEMLFSAVLEFLDRHHLPGVVLQRVVPAHLHAPKVTLNSMPVSTGEKKNYKVNPGSLSYQCYAKN